MTNSLDPPLTALISLIYHAVVFVCYLVDAVYTMLLIKLICSD